MTAPRIIVAGATTAITRRTTMRKAFLAPWHPDVPRCWLYALADAQRETEVAIHHGTCVITHHHVTATPEHPNLPKFARRFHRDVSCALNTLLARERYDAPGELFDGRKAHYMRLMDAAAQATQIQYEHLNCVAAGLVARPQDMPGEWFHFDLWKQGYLDVERPDVYFDSSRPAVIRMPLTPPPELLRAFDGDLDRLVYHMKRLCEHARRALRQARTRAPVGARAVRRIHPWSEPRTLREPGGQRIPTFRIGARGIDGRSAAIHAATEVHLFRRDHGDTGKRWRAGDIDVCFPHGTYAMRFCQLARVETEPAPSAFVTKPGLLPSQMLRDGQLRRDLRDLRDRATEAHELGRRKRESEQLLHEAREAFDDEAAELVANAEMHVDDEAEVRSVRVHTRSVSAADTARDVGSDEPSRPLVHTRHRFAPPIEDRAATRARRIVTLRDARRGRPKKTSTRHGADPPA